MANPNEWPGTLEQVSPLGPISFISMQFFVKILPNSRFLSQSQGLAPRLGNPGSAFEDS